MAFFQGSLQEGIAAALQQSKSVVCFVTDGETESQVWEEDFFAEEEIRTVLLAQAVSLRLPAGSQEEGFLSQLYPIPKKPTVVIIRNGELKEYIASGTSKEDFTRRMKAALTTPPPPPPAQPAAPEPAVPASSSAAPEPAGPSTSTAPPTQQPDPTTSSSASSSAGAVTPPSPGTSHIQALFAERAARLAEKKKADDEAAKQQRAAKAQAKADAEASGLKQPNEQSKHAAALRKKQQEAREERQRILKAIEDDKAARRAQRADAEAARREKAKAAAASGENAEAGEMGEGEGEGEALPFAPASQRLPTSGAKMSGHCSMQVRLLDGATIRSRFASGETMADVRRWVDDNTPKEDKKEAYVFKVLLTPQPSRTIDRGEEGKTLEELGLVPTSTLILLRAPKKRVARASFGNGGSAGVDVDAEWRGNAFQRLLAYVLMTVTGFFSTVAAFFSTFFSLSGPPAAPEPAGAEPSSSGRTSQSQTGVAADAARRRGGRIAGLEERDERRNDQQFYNGNSTNFEPRADDGE